MNEQGDRPQVDWQKDLIRAAAEVLAHAALDLVEADPHQFSNRPCATCRTVSTLTGRPFGCQAAHARKGADRG